MFWQQRMTPATADPAQQKMMMFMPIMFGFIFLTTRRAALVLYWFVEQPLGDRTAVLHELDDRSAGRSRRRGPPAERRLKNAGAGRTAGAEKQLMRRHVYP